MHDSTLDPRLVLRALRREAAEDGDHEAVRDTETLLYGYWGADSWANACRRLEGRTWPDGSEAPAALAALAAERAGRFAAPEPEPDPDRTRREPVSSRT